MTIRKFLCTVTKETEILVELDDQKITEEWMKGYSKYFSPTEEFEDVAHQLAFAQENSPDESFIEGFGHVLRGGKLLFTPLFGKEDTRVPIPGINLRDRGSSSSIEVKELK